MDWQIRAIRGATTASANSVEAIAEAVTEMLDALESQNHHLDPTQIVSATFSVTRDLDAIFPAAIARARPRWDAVPLLDVQQMHVKGSLPQCIRLMVYAYFPIVKSEVRHIYLRDARDLRPDLCLASD